MPVRDSRGDGRADDGACLVGPVAGLEHARVLSADLPDGRPRSGRSGERRIMLIGAAIALFALVPLVMAAVMSLPQRFGFTLGRGGSAAAAAISVMLVMIVACVPVLAWAVLGVRANAARWRAACDSIAGGGDPDVADALATACGKSGPHASWRVLEVEGAGLYKLGSMRAPRRMRFGARGRGSPAGALPAPMTIVSRQLVPDIAAIAPVPGLLEPEAVVQTLGRGKPARRMLAGLVGGLMLAGVAVQLPTLPARGWLSALALLPMAGFGILFLLNAIFGSALSRWRADRAGPADAPTWCGPGWIRWNRRGGRHVTWSRSDSVMVVLARGSSARAQWGEVWVHIAGPGGAWRLGFDSIDGEFARLWRAWTAESARDPDTGAPAQAREL